MGTTLVADKRDRWDEYLPQVLAIRTRTHSVTGYSPFTYSLEHTLDFQTTKTPPRSSLMPLDEIERMEENSEFIARNLEEVGQARSAANVRTKAQAEAMRKRNGFDKHIGLLLQSWRYGNLLDYDSAGSSTSNAVNQADLAPWLAPVIDNVDFFYDGTNRNSALDS
ncbi:hypothetical protein BASA83_008894 [Batrachochytrium salamandrivorans]|nr:hypothetical protein BASA83_008894 [Batrachochytrium salamandrivorans]